MKKLLSWCSAFVLSLSSLLVLTPQIAHAATVTWDGEGPDENFSTASNWSGDVVPSPGDDLVFPANIADTTLVNDLADDISFNSITFSGVASSNTGSYAFTEAIDNDITLVAGITNTSTGTPTYQSFDFDITLSASQSFTTSGGSYDFNGNIALGSNNLSIDDGNNSIWFWGVISDVAIL